eukprot:COSAG02_NODE_31618_length_530_cov_1.190255_1_plen_34_part_01
MTDTDTDRDADSRFSMYESGLCAYTGRDQSQERL